MSKKLLLTSGVISLLVIAGILFQSITSQMDQDQEVVHAEDGIPLGTIVVSGEGVVTADPDIAYVRLGAETTESSADAAQTNVGNIMESVRKALIEYGVDESGIETAQFHVNPYGREGEQQFRAYHLLNIEYREIENVGDLLDIASKAGANIIEPVRFAIEDSTKLEHEALQLAIEKTKGKADAMAKAAGKSRGEVVQLVEQGANIDLPYRNYVQYDMAESAIGSSGTVIEAGEVKVIQRVNVVYNLN